MQLCSKCGVLIAVFCLAGVCGWRADAQQAQASTEQPAPAVAADPTAPAASPVEVPAATGMQSDLEAGAADVEQRERTMGEAFVLKLRQGGLTMVFLLLASIAGVGYAIERFVNLRAKAVVPDGLASRAHTLWQQERWEALRNLPNESNSTLARALAVVARHRHSTLTDVSTIAGDVASRDLRRHLQKAYPLAVVATVSPLLGLLGTVIGMIGAFDKVAAAGSLGDASLLGGDISKALITTGAGLTIAVPALVLYHYFKSRTQQLGLALEEEMGELLSTWYGSAEDVSGKENGADED